MHMTKKSRNTMKPPSQTQSSSVSSLVFEGVYNNARMLHFLTAVVGSTCDVRVKNGTVYEGIFKTLSSQCELAVDAVHKRSDGDGGGGGGGEEGGGQSSPLPKIEDITETMIFSPSDLVTMTCRDVDLNFAIRDTFTDTAISSSRLNGEHREKVLQRWDGDGNGENFELEADTSNGWDANEMFKFNEETYGVKSTYDSSLSMYTMPLEKGNSEVFRQREARAARLASEIESNLQYRRRVSLENDEGRSEEDKFSSVVRDREDRASPGFTASSREGKYIPLPQRAREIGLSAGRTGASGRSTAPASSRHPPPSSSSPKPSSDRSSPLSVRTAYSPHQSQSSPPAASSPPCTNHVLPHSLSHPQALADTTRSNVNGVASRTSPKSQRLQSNRTLRTPNSQSSPAVSRAPKLDAPSQDPPSVGPAYLDSSPSTVTTATATTKPSGPTPLFPVDVNEILSTAAKERTESLSSPQEGKSSKAPSVQQRSQLEELRKFGKEFRLQPSSSPSSSPASADPPPDHPAPPVESSSSPSPGPPKPAQDLQPTTETTVPTTSTAAAPPLAVTPGPQPSGPEGPQPGSGQLTIPGSGEEASQDGSDRAEAANVASAQVKNSTLNPNAKEFLPIKGNTVLKPASTPTPPRPTPPSPSVVLPPPGQPGGGAIYSSPPGHYLSYVSPITLQGHSIQAPQMYQYTMSTVNQGKYPRPKGPVVGQRPDHHASPASSMISAAASAAGPPLVASPYPQSYLQYGQVIQAMPPHYHGQVQQQSFMFHTPVYSMLQSGARMLTSGAPPQPMGPPGPQYPGQGEGPPGPQQAMYAPQSFSHHQGSIHHPQPSSTPTGSQPPPQHTAPSPGHAQASQSGPQPQSLFHSGGLSAPTPPNLPPGHSSPQASYTMQGYSLQTHQPLPHGFASISQLTQAHVPGGLSGPHHTAGHGPPPVMLHYAPTQQGGGSNPQHGPPPQQGAPQHFYIGPPQAVQVQAHPTQQLSFHPSAN
ncbi:ataxin-2-like protein isoform X2 [Stegastes partitus]|uniref:Ataxin-2-like protein isoform X2 n=1 Tax=Stegastes partitus TaxID=144197 RepID=A0A9Y4NUD4_9TELE|nr:PREDICTED: ataxin-2-like protein isoform X2 [Stegastes partitus]